MQKFSVVCLLGLASCIKTLPPPQPPSKEFAKMSGAAPRLAPGSGRVYLDVTEGPAAVAKAAATATTAPQTLCLTPCFVDLPYGQHSLTLTLQGNAAYTETFVVNVTEEPTAERRSLAMRPTINGKWLAFGSGAVVTGIIGLASVFNAKEAQEDLNFAEEDFPGDPFNDIFKEKRNRAIGFAAVSIPATVVLGYLFQKAAPSKREGASTRWPIRETPALVEFHERSLENEQAASLYADAEARYNAQDYQGALKLFQEAYVLSKKPELLINLGQCYRQMKMKEEARKSFQAFLREAPDSEFVPQVERLLQELN